MKKSIVLTLLLSSQLLSGCVDPAMVVGQPGTSLSSDAVRIYHIDRPTCNFQTIAHIRFTGGYFTMNSMLHNMRQDAAEVGANGLYVLHTQQLPNRELLGTAKAIRHLPA
ncbi:MAG: hypothetical protein ACO3DT_06655 [Gammaproteobacteria bacterium]|jgi:hypothetical protein|nr:hypothetical protein [Gammaproteobacteria bacterium]